MFLSLVEGFSALLFGGAVFYIGRKGYRSVGSRYDILIIQKQSYGQDT